MWGYNPEAHRNQGPEYFLTMMRCGRENYSELHLAFCTINSSEVSCCASIYPNGRPYGFFLNFYNSIK